MLVPVEVLVVPEPVVAVFDAVLVSLAVWDWVSEAVVVVEESVMVDESARFRISSNILGDDHATDARSTRLKITLNIVKERMLL